EARKLLEAWKFDPSQAAITSPTAASSSSHRNLQDLVADAERQIKSLRRLILPRLPLLRILARQQIERRYQPFCQTIADAEVARVRALELAHTHLQTRIAQCQAPHDKALRRAQRKYKRQRVENKRRRDLDLRHAWRTYRRKLAQLQQRRDQHRQTLD